MTKTNQIPSSQLADAKQSAAQARADARTADEALAQAEAATHAHAAELKRAAWQEWADNYDPTLDRQAVITAADNLKTAIAGTELGQALTAYVASILQEKEHHGLAASAKGSGAKVKTATRFEPRVADGTSIKNLGGYQAFVDHLLPSLVLEAAGTQAKNETTAVHQSIREAVAKAEAPEVKVYKVTNRNSSESGHELVGAYEITFVDGVAYLDHDNGALGYFRRVGAYTVEPQFGVPYDWKAAKQRIDAA